MLYFHHISCISPQDTFSGRVAIRLNPPVENKLLVMEPAYDGIPPGMLRRMGKAVRMGVGAALPILSHRPDGILIGTSNGGMEDCIKFLNQIIQYDEGILTPTNFVQSTTNAVAAQIGLMSANQGYNCTHVHRGLSFENALIDAGMLLMENPTASYLLGGFDEISDYNHQIEWLGKWYKKEPISGSDLYAGQSEGTIAGEGAAMFLVSNKEKGAAATLEAVKILHTADPSRVAAELKKIMSLSDRQPDLLLSGENGDSRHLKYYVACEEVLERKTPVARFKHATGEFPSVSALAVWLACFFIENQAVDDHFLKYPDRRPQDTKSVLIYNHYKGIQHSFILLSRP